MNPTKIYKADEQYEILCEVIGCRPAPVVTWWLNNQILQTSSETVSKPNYLKYSCSLSFNPLHDRERPNFL